MRQSLPVSTQNSKVVIYVTEPIIPVLRPYQQEFITEVYAHIRARAKRVLGFTPQARAKLWYRLRLWLFVRD